MEKELRKVIKISPVTRGKFQYLIECLVCKKHVALHQSEFEKKGLGYTCSFKCAAVRKTGKPSGMLGKRHTNETIKKMKSWKPNEAQRKKQLQKTGRGTKHHNWSGKNPSYKAIHNRVRAKFGKADRCEKCHTEIAGRYEWSNRHGNYTSLNRMEWRMLCVTCHRKEDYLKPKRKL